MKTFYAGIELASSVFEICVMNRKGNRVFVRKGSTNLRNLKTAISDFRSEFNGHIHCNIESGEMAAWGRFVFKPLVDKFVVSDPRRNSWVANDPKKGDKIDAFKLAELLRMGRISEVYYDDSDDRQDFKMVVQHYENLTRTQARARVIIKSRLRRHGIIRKDTRVFNPAGRESLLAQITSEFTRESIRHLFTNLDGARKLQCDALKLMKKMAKRFPEIDQMTKLPGIGVVNACRFVAYVQNPLRFKNVRSLWQYSRLGVAQPSSNGRPIGPKHLDRSGCGALKDVSRNAFEAALRRKDHNLFKRTYEESFARTNNATHARLSVQRKVLAVMRAVWISGVPYRDDLG